MTRGRGGRGRGAGAGRGRGGSTNSKTSSNDNCSVAANTSTADTYVNDDDKYCGMCGAVTDDDCIGCDRCPLWFHDSPLCMGLPHSIIQSLKDGGDALLFVCTG